MTCTRTGGSEWGRCLGSRSWVDRSGTFDTPFCSPCQSRTSETLHSSSSAPQSRCGARIPWSVRCGSPECGGKLRATARCRPPERVPPPGQSPILRSPEAGSLRPSKHSLCPPLRTFIQRWGSDRKWTFSSAVFPRFLSCFLQIFEYFLKEEPFAIKQWLSSSVSGGLSQPAAGPTPLEHGVCVDCCVTAYYHYVNFSNW